MIYIGLNILLLGGSMAVFMLPFAPPVYAADATSNNYVIENGAQTDLSAKSASANFKQSGSASFLNINVILGNQYSITARPTHSAISSVYGDLNNDGGIDVADALRTLQIAVGLLSPTQQDWARADVAPLVSGKPTPNGKIDVSDALVILERSVGVVTW